MTLPGLKEVSIACVNNDLGLLRQHLTEANMNTPSGSLDHTPLHTAAINCSRDALLYLVMKGADLTARMPGYGTPLEFVKRVANTDLPEIKEIISILEAHSSSHAKKD